MNHRQICMLYHCKLNLVAIRLYDLRFTLSSTDLLIAVNATLKGSQPIYWYCRILKQRAAWLAGCTQAVD